MKRSRLIIALCIVVVLIGGALWARFAPRATNPGTLATVEGGDAGALATNEAALNAAIEEIKAGENLVSPDEPLTDTDLIARQLFSDYVDLTVNGQATDENIAKLADSYIENISNLDKSRRLTEADIKTIPDSLAAFKAYADVFARIYAKYKELLASEYSRSEGKNLSEEGAALTSFSNTLSSMYGRQADELARMPVPESLKEAHLTLINNHRSSASSYASLAKVDTDPASAFAGIVIAKKNTEEETAIIQSIEKILTDNGI